MKNPLEQSEGKPVKPRKAGGWPEVVNSLGSKLIDSPHSVLLLVILVLGLFVWQLGKENVTKLVSQILDKAWFCVGGWRTSVVIAIGAAWLLRWRERFHQAEVERIAVARNIAIQESLKLPLTSSGKKE